MSSARPLSTSQDAAPAATRCGVGASGARAAGRAAALSLAWATRGVGALGRLTADGRVLAILILLVIAQLRLWDPTPATALRFQAFDLMQRLAPSPSPALSGRVAIIDIDEASIRAIGQWPWSRDRMGALVERLDAAGAAAIGFDVVFSEPDRLSPDAFAENTAGLPPMLRGVLAGLENTDDAFARALAASPTVLGMSGAIENPRMRRLGEAEALDASSGAAASARTPVLAPGGDPRPFLFGFPSLLANLPVLERAAQSSGLFNLAPEHDGVVRRVPAAMRIGDRVFPALSLALIQTATGASHINLALGPGGVDAVTVGEISAPTDANARLWLRYAPHEPALYHSASDVLSGAFPAGAFDGAIVLVGTSAAGLRDLRITPLGETIPGVEVHAQLIDDLLAGETIARPAYAPLLEHGIALFAALVLILGAPRLTAAQSLPVLLVSLAAIWSGAVWAFVGPGWVFDPTYPSLAAIAVYATLAFAAYARAEAQRRQIRSAFSQYLSPAMVERLADDPNSLALGGETREMTFLFCDIAGFTAFVERAQPEQLVKLLNAYLDGVCKIVMRHGGTIDKIVGDAVHAMFNAPLDDPQHAANAVRAALEIEAFVEAFRARQAADGVDFGATRIGVNTGPAVVGNFGGESRFDYTAHGDAINTAARLEGANKHLGTTICVAGSTVERCPEIAFRPIGALGLKGKVQGVEAFEPVRASADPDHAAAYRAAFDRLRVNAPDIATLFDRLAEAAPNDPLVALHRRRLAAGEQGVAIRMTET